MSNQAEWQQQSDTLNRILGKTKTNIQARTAQLTSPTVRQSNTLKTLVELLDCLQTFAHEHYNFFRDIFFGPDAAQNDQTCSKFPPEYVFSVIFDQISFDLSVITQAANQRLTSDTEDLQALEKADEIARLALQPVMADFNLQDTRVVTYFKKDTSIRVIPYAPVALIGIPYTAVSLSQDLLAIPHEVAHYLYWHGTLANGRTLQEELAAQISEKPEWRYQWLEEAFADIYGGLTAGPVIALSFQDLQMRNTPKEFVENDEDHPVPILRPNIYTRVIKEEFPQWEKPLDKRWNGHGNKAAKWQERADKYEFQLLDGSWMSVPEAMPSTNEMIAEILTYIHKARDKKALTWWHDYLKPGMKLNQLYQAFADHVAALTLAEPTAVPDLIPPDFAALRQKWLEQGQKLTNAPAWVPVLNAGGWAVKGPHCEGSGTCD